MGRSTEARVSSIVLIAPTRDRNCRLVQRAVVLLLSSSPLRGIETAPHRVRLRDHTGVLIAPTRDRNILHRQGSPNVRPVLIAPTRDRNAAPNARPTAAAWSSSPLRGIGLVVWSHDLDDLYVLQGHAGADCNHGGSVVEVNVFAAPDIDF